MPSTKLYSALREASVPTLLMCLAQLTLDDSWLNEPYLPKRDTNLFADESGGLAEEIQQQIRDAIETVLTEIETGTRAIPTVIPEEFFIRMMDVCVAEDVAAEYTPMMLEAMGFTERDVKWPTAPPAQALENFSALIIGAGFSGICAAIKLDKLGINWTLVDSRPSLGGTWLANDYPEAGVDTPNHFYSYTFAPNHHWSGYFSKRDEVRQYCLDVADRHRLTERISFSTTVQATTWYEPSQTWRTTLLESDGSTRQIETNIVISAVGQLNRPKKTFIRGLDTFTNPCFHSAEWRHDVDLTDKRVAIVGTGASAMQLLRTVAAQATHVTIFQRSPQWVRPSADYHRQVKPETMWLFDNVPHYFNWYRFGLFWRFGDGLLRTLRRDHTWPHLDISMNRHNDKHREQLTDYLKQQLATRPDLIDKTLPDYPPYGKRMLVDNDWYKTLTRDNVTLVASGVDHVAESTVVAFDGTSAEVDVIILATGFEAGKMLASMQITGRDRTTLREAWRDDDPRAYKGVVIPNFPNFFCLYGPNTNVAHGGSVIFQAECQMRFITSLITQMITNEITAAEVRQDLHDEYNEALDAEHGDLVWSHPGMNSWYKNSTGRIFSIMPWRFVDYWAMTHDADLNDFTITT